MSETDPQPAEDFLDGKVRLLPGDARARLEDLEPESLDAVVTDPPYALVSIGKRFGKQGSKAPTSDGASGVYRRAAAGFMGKQWDTGETAFAEDFWRLVYDAMKPGAHLVAFSGTRSYHRLAVAIEDAGFEIRDQLAWVYGSGFPKSHDVSKAIDKALGAEREVGGIKGRSKVGGGDIATTGMTGGDYYESAPATEEAQAWQGWGTALKPAWEPMVLARKPLGGTIAGNVLQHGTGALNIDGCRVPSEESARRAGGRRPDTHEGYQRPGATMYQDKTDWELPPAGRFPANVLHDGSDEVVGCFPAEAGGGSGGARMAYGLGGNGAYHGGGKRALVESYADSGSAARFFYTAKADGDDRLGSKHPTVKPLDLMQWLVRLVCPRGGLVLDPFAGTGTTGEAAWREGCRAVLIERETDYQDDIRRRMALALAPPRERKAAARRNKAKPAEDAGGSIFDLLGGEVES